MQFQVPQFIETEDRIIGPFTIRQFIYIAASGGTSFALYFRVETWLWAFLSIFIVGGGVGLAFVKINGRSLPALIISMFSFYWKPHTYVWQSPEDPRIRKEDVLESPGIAEIVSGFLLKSTLRNLQTGSKSDATSLVSRLREAKDRYQIFQKMSGERKAARRVDYR